MMANELREKFLKFMESKGHTIILSASLIPQNDPTTLFTGSGMQPMIQYLLGQAHPLGVKIADSQKCFRAGDIDEVGDNRHTTLFEMLGNWSLGDYFKKEQISWMFEFLTEEIGLDPRRIYVTVFRGNEGLGIPRDTEAVKIWQEKFAEAGIEALDVDFAERDGIQGGQIFYYDETKNWWSRCGVPANMSLGEPGGPDSEMFWDFGADLKIHENSPYKNQLCHVNCDCGRFLEIGNNVFMQYIKTEKGFKLLPKGNIDFGGGLERLVAAKNDNSDIFLTDLFNPIIKSIEELSDKKYNESEGVKKAMRIIADHIKAATFILAENLEPSNVERGYVLRRLIRRAVRYGKQLGINQIFTFKVAEGVIDIYRMVYGELKKNKEFIVNQLMKEEEKFAETLEQGLKELNKLFLINGFAQRMVLGSKMKALNRVDAKKAFYIYQTYGFPFEMIQEELAKRLLLVDEEEFKKFKEEFKKEFKKHRELSRAGAEQKFAGGLADHFEQTTKLHTAAHLLLESLRRILGDHVYQKGSNITAERLRFDFSHPQKMTPDEIKKVEDLVNEKIKDNLTVNCEEVDLEKAKEQNAMGVFEHKYSDKVKVYSIGGFSKEICGGPHIRNTSELGKFKILKEESSSSGVRRIKAILE